MKIWIVSYVSHWTGEKLYRHFYARNHAEQFARAMRHPSTGISHTVDVYCERQSK